MFDTSDEGYARHPVVYPQPQAGGAVTIVKSPKFERHRNPRLLVLYGTCSSPCLVSPGFFYQVHWNEGKAEVLASDGPPACLSNQIMSFVKLREYEAR
jgi:hypothetical protein